MSNSYRKHPAGGSLFLNSGTQKNWRSGENRAKRRKVKVLLETEQYNKLPHEKEYGNEWDSPRDGCGSWCLEPDDKTYRK